MFRKAVQRGFKCSHHLPNCQRGQPFGLMVLFLSWTVYWDTFALADIWQWLCGIWTLSDFILTVLIHPLSFCKKPGSIGDTSSLLIILKMGMLRCVKSAACCWFDCDSKMVSALAGWRRLGALQSLVLLKRLTGYLTFSFRWKLSRVPAQACFLSTPIIHWDPWVALGFTLSQVTVIPSDSISFSFLILFYCFRKYSIVIYLRLFIQRHHCGLYLSHYPFW